MLMKIVAIGALTLTFACATTPKAVEKVQPKTLGPALYTLKEGEKTQYLMPLPNKTKISVNWQNVDGKPNPVEAFRGWDLDHDGRFDMLEVLDEAGNTNTWAFDFDGDGIIDAVEGGKQVASKAPMPSAIPAAKSSAEVTPAAGGIQLESQTFGLKSGRTIDFPIEQKSEHAADVKIDAQPFSDARFEAANLGVGHSTEKATESSAPAESDPQPVAH
jgi:hypothetical protein